MGIYIHKAYSARIILSVARTVLSEDYRVPLSERPCPSSEEGGGNYKSRKGTATAAHKFRQPLAAIRCELVRRVAGGIGEREMPAAPEDRVRSVPIR